MNDVATSGCHVTYTFRYRRRHTRSRKPLHGCGEAVIMDAVMSETTARLKQIYMAAQYLCSDDDLWAVMHQLLTDNLPGGDVRAAELLAPES